MPETQARSTQASRGAMWSAADLWTEQLSQLLTFILIGNILGPHVVGVMTMALVATLFLAAFLENGFSDALIQRVSLDQSHFDSTFWLMLVFGTLEGLALWAATPQVARLFSEPQLNDILPLMALSLPCIAVTACYTAMLRRQLQFRQLATRSIISQGTAFVTALAMATLGYGIYSLVVFFLVSRLLSAILIIVVSGLRPGVRITRSALGDIVRFGKHRVAHQVVSYVSLQFDRLMIGIFLGPVVLGLYTVAQRLATALNNAISGVFHRVAFPVLSSRQEDRGAFEWAMREFLTVANLVALPAFIGLAVTSSALIGTMFTSSWLPAAALLQILCLAALAGPTNYILTAATNALGRADLVLKLSLAVMAVRVAVILAAAQFSVEAVAVANAGAMLLSVPMFLVAANRLFGGKWTWLFRDVWLPALATLLMAAATLMAGSLLPSPSSIVALACQVLVGIAAYVIFIRLLAPKLFRKAFETIGFRRSSYSAEQG
ncbi:MAG: lipopolysaccharide biosynthesis protein [Dongiaceae bacterium]